MHDWELVSLHVEWAKGSLLMVFNTYKHGHVTLEATRLFNLIVPRFEEWGPSDAVNEVKGPTLLDNGNFLLEIEVQSGDRIIIEAGSIQMPINN